MAYTRIVSLFLFCYLFCYKVQAQEILSRVYDSLRINSAFNSEHGYLLYGTIFNNNNTNKGLIMKTNDDGAFVWAKYIADTNYNLSLTKTIQLRSKQFLSLGFAINPVNFDYYSFIIKSDTIGNCVLTKKILPTDSLEIYDFVENDDASITFCGNTYYGNIPVLNMDDKRFALLNTDSNLNFVWAKEYGVQINSGFYSISKNTNDNYIVQGIFNDTTNYQNLSFSNRKDILVASFDSTGNLLWGKRIGNPFFPVLPGYASTVCQPGKILVLNSGEMINAFTTQWYPTQFTTAKDDVILQRLDSAGNELNSQRFGDETYGSQIFSTLALDKGDIIFGAGQFLIKSDSMLQMQWINSMQQANGYSLNFSLEEILKSNNDTGYIGVLPVWKSNIIHSCFFKTDSFGKANCINLPLPFFTQSEIVGSNDITSDLFASAITVLFDSSLQFTTTNQIFTDTIICRTSTSISEMVVSGKISLYPTLVQDKITIETKGNSNWKYCVFDINGVTKIAGLANNNMQEVSCRILSQGMYIVKITNGVKQFHFKIIKL